MRFFRKYSAADAKRDADNRRYKNYRIATILSDIKEAALGGQHSLCVEWLSERERHELESLGFAIITELEFSDIYWTFDNRVR